MSRLILLGSIALTLALLAGCGDNDSAPEQKRRATATQDKTVTDNFETTDSPSMQFLPRQEEVAGWRLEDDPLVLPAARLQTYLDRDARHFQLYEVIDLTVGKYVRTDGKGFASVEIFRFPDFVKSFGAYSMRRKGVVNFLDIGNESFVGRHSIHLWRGPFYVRMIGGGDQNPIEAMKPLAGAVAERMPAAPGKPAVFSFFPEKYRLINSEVFSAEPGFGQPFLTNAFLASFDHEGEALDGLILPAASKEAAKKILDQYRAFFVSNGRLLDPIPNLGEDNFTGEDQFLGRTVAMRLDRFIIAFRGYKDKQKLVDLAILTDQRVLNTIRKQLQSADKMAEGADDGDSDDETPAWARQRE